MVEPARSDGIVLESTASKVRIFLLELAEGTSSYRSLHNLTEQVEHQYHGRFIVELLQNAHDALFPLDQDGKSTGRIEIALKDEGDFGALYVANDGNPFSVSNFNHISQLGQSDKDPQESIGNKGIGFRSVLEISSTPQIFSRSSEKSPNFDGFCFGFSPDVIRDLSKPVLSLFHHRSIPQDDLHSSTLREWSDSLAERFRTKVSLQAAAANIGTDAWLEKQLSFLSPYLLPLPLRSTQASPEVAEFASRGFATVIRLPLKGRAAQLLVRSKIEELNGNALLFLDRAAFLTLDSGVNRRELARTTLAATAAKNAGTVVTISDGLESTERHYKVWSRTIVLSEAPISVQAAIKELPGRWPELREARVSIAVAMGDEPEPGTVSVVLPTLVQTGCGAHVSASFFAEMSRTNIDFGAGKELAPTNDAHYNRFLFFEAARLAVSAIASELAGGDTTDARAIIDLLAPLGSDQKAIERWKVLTTQAAGELGADIRTAHWFLADDGWGSLEDISLLPVLKNANLVVDELLREHAVFSAFVSGLRTRAEQIKALSEANGIPVTPNEDDLADTVESIAAALHGKIGIDWNLFWADVIELFNGDLKPLTGKRVLLGNDGQLHTGGSNKETVFFVPIRGGGDDEDFDGASQIKDIPSSLRPFVAFLDESIRVTEEKNNRLQTRTRKLLSDAKLVSQFRREDILRDVLIPRTPSLPVPLSSDKSDLCRDILGLALRLMGHLIGRPSDDPSVKLLQKIAAPSLGGWYALGEAAFGPSWEGTDGNVAFNYLSRVDNEETREAIGRLLLPPSDRMWPGSGDSHIALLRVAGVFDGLRLVAVDPKSWQSSFSANSYAFSLPPMPAGLPESLWTEYRAAVQRIARPAHKSGTYEVQRFYTCPGFSKYSDFNEDTRLAFMEVFLASASRWPQGWETLEVDRVIGNADKLRFTSPLAYRLKVLAWLGIKEGQTVAWFRPSERWHVAALELRGRHWQFAHLKPLPGELANRLDTNSRLKAIIAGLGTSLFDPDIKSGSPALLNALVEAVVRGEVPNWDVFLGQVRAAWRGFEPKAYSDLPKTVLVQRAGSSRVFYFTPSKEDPVCLPDSRRALEALKHFDVPVIAIEADDAKRLAGVFDAKFPGAVIRASGLRPEPLVNGLPWTTIPSTRLRDDATLIWMIPVLLTISAFHGSQSQGTTSKAFRKQVNTCREARLAFVEQIQSGLFLGTEPFTSPLDVPALWLGTTHTLLVGQSAFADLGGVSEALSDLLEREDLEVPIRLMIGTAGLQPSSADILRALEQLKLTEQHYNEAREHWRGDVGHTIELLTPLLTIVSPAANIGRLVELESDEDVISFLDSLPAARLTGQAILQLVHESADMFEFGRNAHVHWGDDVELVQWNAALTLRDQEPLVNREAASEFKTHLASALPALRSVLAYVASTFPKGLTYRAALERLEDLECPAAFANELWEVTFAHTASVVSTFYESLSAPDVVVLALRDAKTVSDLSEKLTPAGVTFDLDPLQVARDNREKLRAALARLQQIGFAWAVNKGDATAGNWETRTTQYTDLLAPYVEESVFTRSWSDRDLIELFRLLPKDNASELFWSSLAEASSLDNLVDLLGLSQETLATAKTRLAEMREEATRRKRVVQVCGGEFDGAEENFASLWQHICLGLPDAALLQLTPVDLASLSSLRDVAARKKRKSPEQKPTSKTKRQYPSKALDELIGLTGEIHAFRMLQQKYGSSVVSASNWVSENSLYVYPDNKVSDGMGCDFLLELEGRICHIEVKASSSDDESFLFGSSEINLALRLAGSSRRRRKETFLILHVSNALSVSPSFQLLPNPYERQYASMFVIDEANARVRYELDRSQ